MSESAYDAERTEVTFDASGLLRGCVPVGEVGDSKPSLGPDTLRFRK